MIGEAYELDLMGKLPEKTPICPMCKGYIFFDKEDDKEYCITDEGDCFHLDCALERLKEHGGEFIKDTCLEEYCELWLDCRFNEFALPMSVINIILSDKEQIEDFIKTNYLEEFCEWWVKE